MKLNSHTGENCDHEGAPAMSRYDCAGCGATPHEEAIHRTSPKGQDFEGKCADCLGVARPSDTFAERLADAMEPIVPNEADDR